jgi:hypothetical protein
MIAEGGIDWQEVYRAGRAHMRTLSSIGQLMSVAVGFAIMAIGFVIFLVSGELLVLPVTGILAALAALWIHLHMRRSTTGNPVVLVGQVLERTTEGKKSSSNAQKKLYYLDIELADAFVLQPDGQQQPLAERTGRQRVRSNARLFEQVREQEEVALVCVPSGLAFARAQDLLEEDEDEA